MQRSSLPDELDEQQAMHAEDRHRRPDPRREPGVRGLVARYPLWLIVGAVVAISLVLIYVAALFAPVA